MGEGGSGWWGQGGCERRIEVFVKNSKKKIGGGGEGGWVGGGRGRVGRGVRVDVNGELEFLGEFTRKKIGWGGRQGGGSGVGSDWWGGGGDHGGCERRIEVFVKIQKKMGGGEGGGVGSGGLGFGSGWM